MEVVMRKPIAIIVLSSLLVIPWVAFFVGVPRAAEEAKPVTKKWEYRILYGEALSANSAGEKKLNALGAEGWEAYAATQADAYPTVYLRRPKN
jgi:hypothetical protein